MAVSRAELEAMDRDELIETIVELGQTVEDLELRLNAMSRWKKATNDRLEDIVDANQRLQAENKDLKNRLDDIEATAEQAMTVASRGHDPDSRSKTEVAKAITRNTLVKRAVISEQAQDRALTTSDVSDRAEPEHTLRWQTIRNAWNDLLEEWPQFHETTKNGQQAISVKRSGLTKGLLRAVEHDLGRSDLTKRFVGGNGGGPE